MQLLQVNSVLWNCFKDEPTSRVLWSGFEYLKGVKYHVDEAVALAPQRLAEPNTEDDVIEIDNSDINRNICKPKVTDQNVMHDPVKKSTTFYMAVLFPSIPSRWF